MPHILQDITDENGNVIGSIRLPHEEGGGNLAADESTDEPREVAMVLNLGRIAELLKEAKKDKG